MSLYMREKKTFEKKIYKKKVTGTNYCPWSILMVWWWWWMWNNEEAREFFYIYYIYIYIYIWLYLHHLAIRKSWGSTPFSHIFLFFSTHAPLWINFFSLEYNPPCFLFEPRPTPACFASSRDDIKVISLQRISCFLRISGQNMD